MKGHVMIGVVMPVLIAVVIMAGCNLGPAVSSPTAAATEDLRPTFNEIGTQAAQTIVAGLTLNAPTITPTVPTSTPLPTETATATSTRMPPTRTPTRTPIPWTATPAYTATPLGYACSITSSSPAANTSYTSGQDFDGVWEVKNTGTVTWSQHAVDIKYLSGTKFQAYADLFDLSSDVASGASYKIIIDMFAPKDPGTYQATWGVVQSDLTICTLTVSITVK
jgi:hypothetical protein